MRIGIDIDNTLTDIEKDLENALYEYVNKLGKMPNEIPDTISDKNNDGKIYQEIFGLTDDELKYFLTDLQENITDSAIPREGVVTILQKLKNEGHEIIIITARDYEFHDDPYLQSKTWLDKNHIIYDKLIVNVRDKKEVCDKEKIDLLIDDNLYNCQSVMELGMKAIQIGELQNSQAIPSFDNWHDIYLWIQSLG